jgi:hypothetical protein
VGAAVGPGGDIHICCKSRCVCGGGGQVVAGDRWAGGIQIEDRGQGDVAGGRAGRTLASHDLERPKQKHFFTTDHT